MTPTTIDQLMAHDVLDLAENPSASVLWLSDKLAKRLTQFYTRANVMAHKEKHPSRNSRESINELLGKVGGIAALGVGAATGVGLPISALIALWANNAYRQGGKSMAEFRTKRGKELSEILPTLKKLEARKAEAGTKPLTPAELDQYNKVVLETNRLSKISGVRSLFEGIYATFPITAAAKAVGHNIRETYKHMSPNAKFKVRGNPSGFAELQKINPFDKPKDFAKNLVKVSQYVAGNITPGNIARAARVVPVVGMGTLYKSLSGITNSAADVVHSANMAIRAVPKIYDWEKVKLAKIQDKGAAWVADKFDGFMKGKWLTKAKDAMTKLSQWPSARESKGANMAMAPS